MNKSITYKCMYRQNDSWHWQETTHFIIDWKWFQCWIVQYRDAPVGGAKGQWNHQVILKRLARSAPKAYQYTFDAISLFKFRIMKPSEMHFSAIFFLFLKIQEIFKSFLNINVI